MVRVTTTARTPVPLFVGRAAVGRARGWLVAGVAAVLASCVSVGTPVERAPAPTVAPAPVLAAVTAPPTARIGEEIDQLLRFGDDPGARLRTAWLHQEAGRWDEAETVLNSVLFGAAEPTPDVAALARYLRAHGFERRGERDRAAHERRTALATVRAPDLRERLLADGASDPAAGAGPGWEGVPVATPPILPRARWRAADARTSRMQRLGDARRITVHHSATLVRSTSSNAAIGAIRGIQRHHQVENGWGDIGYHFLIDPAGRVWTGRSLEWQGAHAGDTDLNQFNVGICLLGNFIRDGQGPPPSAQVRALEGLVTALCVRYHIEPQQVRTHQELKTTDCPGPYVQVAVEQIRERLVGTVLSAGAASR